MGFLFVFWPPSRNTELRNVDDEIFATQTQHISEMAALQKKLDDEKHDEMLKANADIEDYVYKSNSP